MKIKAIMSKPNNLNSEKKTVKTKDNNKNKQYKTLKTITTSSKSNTWIKKNADKGTYW